MSCCVWIAAFLLLSSVVVGEAKGGETIKLIIKK